MISVVIPTHNRSNLLKRLLDALGRQDFNGPLEVVIVADGCHDDTVEMVRAHDAPFSIVILEEPGKGPSTARNAGAAAAAAPLLLFIDDDVEPTPGMISAHLAAHARSPGSAVIGPYPPAPHASASRFRQIVRHWWTAHFNELANPGHRFGYTDMMTGNLSMLATVWRDIGGLDPAFRCHEDYELGVRLMKAGVPFRFAPDAIGYHHEHETLSLKGGQQRTYQEGRHDVLLGRKHPEILHDLKLVQHRRRSGGRKRLIHKLIFGCNGCADGVMRGMVLSAIAFIDDRGLTRLFDRAWRASNVYWYLRGAADELGSTKAFWKFACSTEPPEPPPELVIDLRNGFKAAEAILDAQRPQVARLMFGPREVGLLPFQPCAEPWRGDHLRPALLNRFSFQYLHALALENALDVAPKEAIAALTTNVYHLQRHFGPQGAHQLWVEQAEQWGGLMDAR